MGGPIEFILARVMFTQRKKGVVLTDQRVRMTSEVCVVSPLLHTDLKAFLIITGLIFTGGLLGSIRHPTHQVLRLGVFLCSLGRHTPGTRSSYDSPSRVSLDSTCFEN